MSLHLIVKKIASKIKKPSLITAKTYFVSSITCTNTIILIILFNSILAKFIITLFQMKNYRFPPIFYRGKAVKHLLKLLVIVFIELATL